MDRRSFLLAFAPPPGEPSGSPSAPAALRGTAGLEPFAGPLDRRRAAHLLRRTGFGVRPDDVAALVGRDAGAAVDELVDAAVAAPMPAPPPWADTPPPPRTASDAERMAYQQASRDNLAAFRADWLVRMAQVGLRERMAFFWSDHFVTGLQSYRLAPYAYRYVDVLRRHALGDFKAFVREVGLTPAMLIYLNGTQNQAGAPNENYARELLELFTMGPLDAAGQPNYTQDDVREVARALTGWIVDNDRLAAVLVPRRHDDGEKTFFGRTGRFGYDDVVDVLFEARADAVAAFVCRALYRTFVYAAPDEAVVAGLAAVFRENDFALAPVVRTLLRSAHFFDDQVIGARIKSPIDLLVGLPNEMGVDVPAPAYALLERFSVQLEQAVLNPPNVAGWPGHHAWLTTNTLPLRWYAAEALTLGNRQTRPPDLVPLAERLTDPAWDAGAQRRSPFYLPLALAEHFLAVPVSEAAVEPVAEPFAGETGGYPIPDDVAAGPAYVRDLAKIFLAGTPWFEWNLHSEGAGPILQRFVRYLTQLPEYQLC